MPEIKFYKGEDIPLEMHKIKIVQKINLEPIEKRLSAIKEAGNNTFLLRNRDVFLDMLTDSGVNAMSDKQLGAMMQADDSYAGSETYFRLEEKLQEIFGMKFFLPAHQGRACEHLIAKVLVKEGNIIPMNYHFTTTKSHITLMGGKVEEILIDEGLNIESNCLFKGNIDINKLKELINRVGSENIPFVRMEAGTNLIGGQPFSLENAIEVKKVCDEHKIRLMLDASLLSDNLHFIKVREKQCQDMSIKEIISRLSDCFDIIYFSARKISSARGGGICIRNEEDYIKIRELVPVYEGFLTYGGMSVKEMEAMVVGFDDTLDETVISQGPKLIEEGIKLLVQNNIPVVTPSGGLGMHINCSKFVPHIPQKEYPSGAVASAFYIISGARGMERGTLSEQRDENGNEKFSDMELLRLAVPRRVLTLSHIKYVVDRLIWLYDNRELIGGLRFTEEPRLLRFFFGRLEPIGDWQEKLVEKFKKDFGESL